MTNQLESVPTQWTSEDEAFFDLVASVFDPAFTYGAGVLLATYDTADLSDRPTTDVTAGTRAPRANRDALINTPSE